MGFTDAQAYCNAQDGSTLLVPKNSAENNFFMNMLNDEELGPVQRFWLGIDRSSGQWLDSVGNSLSWENFQSGYGNSGTQAVATQTQLNKADGPWSGQWENIEASTPAHVICTRALTFEPQAGTVSAATQSGLSHAESLKEN